MLPEISKIKGVHPGSILKRELKIQGRRATDLALSIEEHKQTISAVLNNKRSINPRLSIKLASQFNVDADYFMLLQASYDVKIVSSQQIQIPDLSNLRKSTFWDTSFDKIDWQKNKTSVIKRILERGNEKEIKEIISFYGRTIISKEILSMGKSRYPKFEKNIREHKLI